MTPGNGPRGSDQTKDKQDPMGPMHDPKGFGRILLPVFPKEFVQYKGFQDKQDDSK